MCRYNVNEDAQTKNFGVKVKSVCESVFMEI